MGSSRRALLGLSLAYWVAFAVVAEPKVGVPDGAGYYAYAAALVTHGDFALAPALKQFGAWDFFALTPLGHVRNVFALGTALLWLPFVAVAHGLSLIGARVGALDVYAVTFATAFYGYLALCLTYRCVRTVASAAASSAAVAVTFTFTPCLHYTFFAASHSHVPAAFSVALFMYWRLVRTPDAIDDRAYWSVLGACGGLCALVRWELSLLGIVVLIDLATRRRSESVSRAEHARALGVATVCFATSAALVFAPQCLVWWAAFGRALLVPQGLGFLHVAQPQWFALLFSSHHGLYSWAPILVPATVGLVVLAANRARTQREAYLWLAWLISQLYIAAIVDDVHAGASFGARRLVSLTPVFALGLGVCFTRAGRIASACLAIACGAWTTSLLLAFEWNVLPQAAFVSWKQVGQALQRTWSEAPERFAHVRLAHATWIGDALSVPNGGWSVLLALVLLSAVAWVIVRPRAVSTPLMAAAAIALATLTSVAIAVAAGRTPPVSVPATLAGDQALLDFSDYANARYDANPFRSGLKAFARYPELSGPVLWGRVPFIFMPAAGGTRDKASVATNCGSTQRVPNALRLPGTEAIALHFALVARVHPGTAMPVGRIAISLDDGRTVRHDLLSGRDVSDMFDQIPDARIAAKAALGVVQGFTLPFEGRPTALRLESVDPQAASCVTLFAITLEHALRQYTPVDISAIANANHGIDFFSPEDRVNYFPDLRAGMIHSDGAAFSIPRLGPWITAGNALTTASVPNYRQRMPLYPRATRALQFLIDGSRLPAHGTPLARISVEYDRGPPTIDVLRAGLDVHDYEERAAAPIAWIGSVPQDLTRHSLSLDSARIPRFVWIESTLPALAPAQSGIAIFAITQQLRASAP